MYSDKYVSFKIQNSLVSDVLGKTADITSAQS